MVDALDSGVSVLTDVRVQVPLFAPIITEFISRALREGGGIGRRASFRC